MRAPKSLGVDPFPDPVRHFLVPWQPFWIFEVLIEEIIEVVSIRLQVSGCKHEFARIILQVSGYRFHVASLQLSGCKHQVTLSGCKNHVASEN